MPEFQSCIFNLQKMYPYNIDRHMSKEFVILLFIIYNKKHMPKDFVLI